MAPRLTPTARVMLDRQLGVIARWQGPQVGVTSRVLREAAIRDHDWHRVGSRTVFYGRMPPSAEQRRIICCLEAGPQAILGGVAALEEAGWGHRGDGKVDVMVPRGNRASRRELPACVRLHYVNDLPVVLGAVRRTTSSRAVVDAAAWARSDREASFIVTSTLQRQLVTAASVTSTLAGRANVRRSGVIREIVAEFVRGAHSMGELDFVRECRKRGLPEPDRQVPRRDSAGRRRFTDAEFLRADGRVVMVEVDGVGHMSAKAWLADMDRHNDLTISTEALVLRVSAWQLRHDPEAFFARLSQALGLDSGAV